MTLLAFLIVVTILCAIAYPLLRWVDSGALNTEVRCDTCGTPIQLRTEQEQAAYLRGLAVGHDYCVVHAPTVEDAYPECAVHGCTRTRDEQGRFVCARCGRPLAIRERTA